MFDGLIQRVAEAFRPTIPAPRVVREPPTYAVREARIGDRAGAFALASSVRSPAFAVSVAAHADLNRALLCNCGCAQCLRCWVATDAGGAIVGLVALTEALQCLSVSDLLVAPAWRGRGVGRALLREIQQLADSYGIPITAVVRSKDCDGLRWLCERGFTVGKFEHGRPAIRPTAFLGEDCAEGITLVRPGQCQANVRIAE